MRPPNYAIWWSPEDDAWLATEIGREAGTIHGSTPGEALQEAIAIAHEWDDAGYPSDGPVHEWTPKTIRELRYNLSMSQREFARLLNVSVSTVRSWEQGLREPAGPTIRLLDFVQAAPGIARRWQDPLEAHKVRSAVA